MSLAFTSGKKQNFSSDDKEILYDPYIAYKGEDEAKLKVPWPEWSDAELNNENWDESQNAKPNESVGKTEAAGLTAFEDQIPTLLPPLIKNKIDSWKRPQEVFPDAELTVFSSSNGEFKLTVPSPHGQCDYFDCFLEQLPILQFYSVTNGFRTECETASFVSNTQGEPWRPWHHVYALTKAGKGQIHNPQYNPSGKYIIRLFYMGCWRRFNIDDTIPCDENGLCMLPVTQIPGELWPLLLTKAVLKIIALTPSYEMSLTDFHLLPLFTAWINLRITATSKTQEQVWRRFQIILPHFQISEKVPEVKTVAPSFKEAVVKKGSSKKETKKEAEKKNSFQTDVFCFVMANLTALLEEDEVLSKTHTVAITMCRDIPLIKYTKRERTKMWKKIRWIYWASKKGLWTDELSLPPYRRLMYISFIENLKELLAPDPKQEATIFNTELSEKSDANGQLLSSEKKNEESEEWADFYKLYECLTDIAVLIKPSIFASNFVVTYTKNDQAGRAEDVAPGAKTTAKPLQPTNFYFQPLDVLPTCNEPAVLFCESKTGIFLCISICVCPRKCKSSTGYLESDHPEILRVTHATVLIERSDWRTVKQGEIIGAISTVGSSSTALILKPGRQILKIWLNSDCPYVVNVYSNVQISVDKSPKIRFAMVGESERIMSYIHAVSNAFIALVQKFGKPDLPSALRDFYNEIKPGNDKIIGYHSKMDAFIDTFLDCIMLVIRNVILNTDDLKIILGALRSLFFNPKIKCDSLPSGPPLSLYGGGKKVSKKAAPVLTEKTLSEILSYPWSADEINKVRVIQKNFRGFRVRLLWKFQTPSRKEFKPYTERLKKVCDTIFATAKREIEVGRLIRKIILARPDLLETFRFYEDFSNVMEVDEYSGKIANVEPFAWVPITRFVVACHGKEAVPFCLYFSCNLEQYIIQSVNNDTKEELFRLTNCVSPQYYQSNNRGYTFLIFGWNEANVKTVNWRIEMVNKKHFEKIHLCNTLLNSGCHPYSIPNLDISEVKNFYIPNRKHRICRCLIKVQKTSLLTLRLSLSYSEARFVVSISLDKKFCPINSENSEVYEKILINRQSTDGVVILSSVILDYVEPNAWWGESFSEGDYTVYILEAYVLNHSWPLTKHEWGVIEPIRVKGENWQDSLTNFQSKKGSSGSRKKLSRLSKKNVNDQRPVENPNWLLQVLSDSNTDGPDLSDQIIVEEDRSYADAIRAMKLSWEEKDPGRRKRGQKLRNDFLCQIYMEDEANQSIEIEGIFDEIDGESGDSHDEHPRDLKTMLNQISSFSYLKNDLSPRRYHKSPRILPPMPTAQLINKYKKQQRQEEFENEGTSDSEPPSEISNTLNRNMPDESEEDRKDFLNQCVHFRLIMVNCLLEEQKLSTLLMEQAYEMRLKAVERLAR